MEGRRKERSIWILSTSRGVAGIPRKYSILPTCPSNGRGVLGRSLASAHPSTLIRSRSRVPAPTVVQRWAQPSSGKPQALPPCITVGSAAPAAIGNHPQQVVHAEADAFPLTPLGQVHHRFSSTALLSASNPLQSSPLHLLILCPRGRHAPRASARSETRIVCRSS